MGMTTIDATRTVAEITQSVPGAARTFERLGIDYCCKGKEALARACEHENEQQRQAKLLHS